MLVDESLTLSLANCIIYRSCFSSDFERRYPNATKTVHFKKTKVDFYAPYVQMDGLVRKITIYEDYEYKFPLEVNEKYSNRTDMLIESKKIIDTCAAIDSYKRGRADACTGMLPSD